MNSYGPHYTAAKPDIVIILSMHKYINMIIFWQCRILHRLKWLSSHFVPICATDIQTRHMTQTTEIINVINDNVESINVSTG